VLQLQAQPRLHHDSPFDLHNDRAYRAWRAVKLQNYPRDAQELVVEISDSSQVSAPEYTAIAQRIARSNMAIFTLAEPLNKIAFARFCAQFGLNRLDKNLCADDDGISELHAIPEGRAHEYIPYSNKPINWHTDGYYNTPDRLIRAMVLHCVQAAARGGANALLDHELVYLLLRDADPEFVAALMHPHCMTIPANIENGAEIRAAQTGPVFSVDPDDGRLHMRYTARTRSISWRDDRATRAALQKLETLLTSEHTPIFQHRMQPGQGILCNNVLHTRTAFDDDANTGEQRLVLRARYYDRIDTNLTDTAA
jgi:hypothetical protein